LYCEFEETSFYECPFDESTNDIFDWTLKSVIINFFHNMRFSLVIFSVFIMNVLGGPKFANKRYVMLCY